MVMYFVTAVALPADHCHLSSLPTGVLSNLQTDHAESRVSRACTVAAIICYAPLWHSTLSLLGITLTQTNGRCSELANLQPCPNICHPFQ